MTVPWDVMMTIHRGIRPANRTGSACVPFLRTLVSMQSISHIEAKEKRRKRNKSRGGHFPLDCCRVAEYCSQYSTMLVDKSCPVAIKTWQVRNKYFSLGHGGK